MEYLDSINVEWGITCDSTHDNAKTAEIVHAFPDRFKGFIFVDPNKGMDAVRELEKGVKEYGLHALYLTAENRVDSWTGQFFTGRKLFELQSFVFLK